MFTEDGVFIDASAGKEYRGAEIGRTVEIYAKAFPDMHRELYSFYLTGDIVCVELSLNGTHKGPLMLPMGTIPATGKKMSTPCADVFHIKDGKVKIFHCYPSGTVLLEVAGARQVPGFRRQFVRHRSGWKYHLPPITAYPWISILASGTASAVMVIKALPGKSSPNTSLRIWVRRSP